MKKKGFTLIELIAVIAVLGIILAIAVPRVNQTINNSYMQTYEMDLESIKQSAISYVLKKNMDIKSDSQSIIYISDMVDIDLLDPIIDPKTGVECDGYATVSKNNDNYIIHPYLKCGENYISENYNKTDFVLPTITLLGDNPINMYVGDIYIDPGVRAFDNVDGDITSKVITSGYINPNVAGSYTITYNVKDNNDNEANPITRTINVIDNVGPTITFDSNGNSTYAKSRSTIVRVRDNAVLNESSLRYQWTTSTTAPAEASFTTSFTNRATLTTPSGVTGNYYLWILAKDKVGNKTISGSNVFILDNTKPVITMNGTNPITINAKTSYLDPGATATDAHSGITGSLIATGSVNPSVPGTYTITYTISDRAGNTATSTRTVNVVDVNAPVITLTGSNPTTISGGSTYSDAGATALDDVDGDLTSKIAITGTVNPNVLGTYTITYTVKDSSNNATTTTRTVNVVDNILPIISNVSVPTNWTSTNKTITVTGSDSGLSGIAGYYISTSSTKPTLSSSWTSSTSTTWTVSEPAGTYYIWIKDKAGNISTSSRTVSVTNIDATTPTVSIGSGAYTAGSWSKVDVVLTSTINPASTASGYTYQWYKDGAAISGATGTTYTVSATCITGTYTHNVTTGAGKSTTSNGISVKVDKGLPPVSFGTNGNYIYNKSYKTTVSVSETCSGLSTLKYLWNTSTTTPTIASITGSFTNGSTLTSPLGVTGSYYLWILAIDNAGNTTITRTNVFNLDNTVPVITMNGSSNVTIDKGSTYTDAGATATDAHSGINGSVAATGSVNTNIVGTYTITYNVSDKAGNAAVPVTRTVNVKDVLAPTITIAGSNPVTMAVGSTYSDAGATALDDVDGNVTSKIATTSTVNPSVGGTYTVTYRVADNAGNVATATRTVIVKYCSSGTITYNSSLGYVCLKSATASSTCNSCTYNTTATGQNCSVCGSTCNSCTYMVYATPSTTAATVSKSCSDGSTYVASVDKCRTYTSDRVYSCSSGSVSGTNCVVSASSSRTCSSGTYVSSVDRCRIYTSTRVYSCSSGTVDGTQCRTTSYATPTCSSGSFVSGSGCKTTTTSYWSTSGLCANNCSSSCGYNVSRNQWGCVTARYSTPSCSSGYTLNSTTTSCYKYSYTTASVSCPSGWSMSSADNCYQNVTDPVTTYSCSSGTLSGSKCVIGSATESCPSGWTMSSAGNCYQNTVTPTTNYSCSSGNLYSGTCYICPSGYTGNFDIDTSTMGCSSTATGQNCSSCGSTCNSCSYTTSTYGANCSSCGSTTTYPCGSWTYYDGYDSGTRCYVAAQ